MALRPKSTQLLSVLASLPGQTIDKRTLMDAVWGEVHVTEDSLTKCIGDIRVALGDDATHLETVPRRGYRLRAVPVAPPGASRLTLRVMGLEDLTGSPRWQRIARGISGEITRVLSTNPWLAVLRGGGPQEGGFALSGDLLADGGRVLISLCLTAEDTGEVVWSARRDFSDDDVFSMIDETAAETVAGLAQAWTGAHVRSLRLRAHRRLPGTLGGFEHWLLGVEAFLRFDLAGVRLALDHATKAVAADPEYTAAWSLVTTAHHALLCAEKTRDLRQPHRAALLQAARRCAALDPEDPIAMMQGALLAVLEGSPGAAMEILDRTVALQPNNPDVLARSLIWGGFCAPLGGRAKDLRDRLLSLVPGEVPFHRHALGFAAYHSSDYMQAFRILEPFPFPLGNALFMISAAVRTGEPGHLASALATFRAVAPPDLTVTELLEAHGTVDPLRAAILEDATVAGLLL
ncbi:winged helix-turn-helix domain-containing protein [Candidatus Rhodobacter oscarellae]|nr:winged helix-turn-helix domain-containing protein [Candidatus Rhodobacter lobularis]